MLPWPCISASAVLQPALLAAAATNSSAAAPHLALAIPQVLLCGAMLALLLTVGVSAATFCWPLAKRRADAEAVTDFGLQVGMLCGLQAGLNLAQLLLSAASRQLTSPAQLGALVWLGWLCCGA